MNLERWLFDESRLANSPSRQHGIEAEKETGYMQQVSNFIQEMGRKLQLPLLCINTAVLFTQRFYVFHSLTVFEKFALGAAALFLAAKVEEHPRKVEHFSKAARLLINRDISDADYIQDLLFNEHVLLQTLGFELQVQHPHQHVLRLCDLVKVTKDLSQASYVLATYCLHLTKMCLMYKPTIIACVCIHMACKCLGWEIPVSREGKMWFLYVDNTASIDLLEHLSEKFSNLLLKCPSKYKNRTVQAYHENLVKNLLNKVNPTDLPIVGDVKTSIKFDPTNKTPQPLTPSSSTESNMEGLARSLNDQISSFVTFQNEDTGRAATEAIVWSPIQTSVAAKSPNIPVQSASSHSKSVSKNLSSSISNEMTSMQVMDSSDVPDGRKFQNISELKMRDALLKSSVSGRKSFNKSQNETSLLATSRPVAPGHLSCLTLNPSATMSQKFESSPLNPHFSSITSTGSKLYLSGGSSTAMAEKRSSGLPAANFDRRSNTLPICSPQSRTQPTSQKMTSMQRSNSQPFMPQHLNNLQQHSVKKIQNPSNLIANQTQRILKESLSPMLNKPDGKKQVQSKTNSSPSTGSLKLNLLKNRNSWNVSTKESLLKPSSAPLNPILTKAGSLKISIPKSKVPNMHSWPEAPHRSAAVADANTSPQHTDIPLTGSFSPDTPPLKRFKTN